MEKIEIIKENEEEGEKIYNNREYKKKDEKNNNKLKLVKIKKILKIIK